MEKNKEPLEKICNYLKPTAVEKALMVAEIPLSLAIASFKPSNSILETIGYSILPQVATYTLGRLYESFGKENYAKNKFLRLK